eukprot:CAMPEP_0178405422 /NCGR_PEP_ID=MMETSP0689_2-20121128/18390_1 /TAXON_ID=160604 /ORGANISM="Amphidinium massartii, Strain CS-259" /LENGTH=345 /DNA_ID=CAMNT_0020026435 /DNA_START=34 /DNA_END=1068 /DNA_ORIENTATION=-
MGGVAFCSVEAPPCQFHSQVVEPLPEEVPFPASSRGSQLLCSTPVGQATCVAIGCEIAVYSGVNGEKLRDLDGGCHSGPVTCMVFALGHVYSGSIDKAIKKWDPRKRKCLGTFRSHSGPIWCLWSHEAMLMSCSEDHSIIAWSLQSGEPVYKFLGHSQAVVTMLGHDGNIISGSSDATVRIWNAASGKMITAMEGHKKGVLCLLVTEQVILSGGQDGLIRKWSMRGDCLGTLDGHTDWVTAMTSLEKGSICSCSRDENIMCWDLETCSLLAILEGHEHGVNCLTVHDGVLISGAGDGTVKCWDVSIGELVASQECEAGVTCLLLLPGNLGVAHIVRSEPHFFRPP